MKIHTSQTYLICALIAIFVYSYRVQALDHPFDHCENLNLLSRENCRDLGRGAQAVVRACEVRVQCSNDAEGVVRGPALVAIKSAPRRERRFDHGKFTAEAQRSFEVRSPHVVKSFHPVPLKNGEDMEILFELGDFNLEDYLKKRNGTLDKAEIQFVLQQGARGLYELHMKGIAHLDIKEANLILFRKPGTPEHAPLTADNTVVKVGDLGISESTKNILLDRGELWDVCLNKALYRMVGTLEYMAPLLVLANFGDAYPDNPPGIVVNIGSDLHSLGAMAFHMAKERHLYAPEGALTLRTDYLSRVAKEGPMDREDETFIEKEFPIIKELLGFDKKLSAQKTTADKWVFYKDFMEVLMGSRSAAAP